MTADVGLGLRPEIYSKIAAKLVTNPFPLMLNGFGASGYESGWQE